MAERRETNPLFSAVTVLAVTGVASGLFFLQPSIRSSRPGNKLEHERTSAGDQTVDARLWQDPFEAIHPKVLEGRNQRKEAGKGSTAAANPKFEATPPKVLERSNQRKEKGKGNTSETKQDSSEASVREIARQIE